MLTDEQYSNIKFKLNEQEHLYGDKVHLVGTPTAMTLLSKLCSPETTQPLVNALIEKLYRELFSSAFNSLFPCELAEQKTRMLEYHAEGHFVGKTFKKDIKAVVVDIARGGIFPGHLAYDELNYLLDPEWVRQDHFYVGRKTDSEGQVVGLDMSGHKIGGDIDKSFLFFPDPMAATGTTISEVIHHYKKNVKGTPQKVVALHLIITPEYLKKVTTEHPDLEIFAMRMDRGLSSPDVLKKIPGACWDEEKGLNDQQYIVPGAGGLGEILNNSFV